MTQYLKQKRLESSVEACQKWRRHNLQWQAVPHFGTSNRKCLTANSGMVNWRLDDAVTAGRVKPLGVGLITASDHRCDQDTQKRPTILLKIL